MTIPLSKILPAALYAGIAAGILATVAQILLWWAFWDVLPVIFYRDARFTAAIILGQSVMPPPATFDWKVIFIATVIHVNLSIAYAVILALLINHLDLMAALIVGSFYGLIVFGINMYGITMIYPWFAEARDWITVIAHVVFGTSAAGIYKLLSEEEFKL